MSDSTKSEDASDSLFGWRGGIGYGGEVPEPTYLAPDSLHAPERPALRIRINTSRVSVRRVIFRTTPIGLY